jgi:hypothetical protein
VFRDRNFYGVLAVVSANAGNPVTHQHIMRNGKINHGAQFQDAEKRSRPWHYHDPTSGVGQAIRALEGRNRRIGVTGLGIGTLAAYGKPGDYFRFYEINPLVIDAARKHFTYLEESAADIDVIEGDARLSMERELERGEPQRFDVLVLDAFSGDAVPTHLLTKEACEIYLRHLEPNGVLAVNVSNLHLDLVPVVAGLAETFGLEMAVVTRSRDTNLFRLATVWVLLTKDRRFFARHRITSEFDYGEHNRPPILWTDDFSNIWQVLL